MSLLGPDNQDKPSSESKQMELQEDQTNDQTGDDTGHSNVDDFGGADYLKDHGSLGEDAGLGQGNATEFNFFCALLDAIIDLDRLLEMQGYSSTSLKKSLCFLDMLYPPLVEHELILCIHSTYPYLTEDAILTRLPVRTDYLFQDPTRIALKSIRLIPFVRLSIQGMFQRQWRKSTIAMRFQCHSLLLYFVHN
jgi:hypothetical protein